jgi:hypothetical protein
VRELLSWLDLTDDECLLAIEAYENATLSTSLWAFGSDGSGNWNRNHRHLARAIKAALTLLNADIINVWESLRDGIGDGGLLLDDKARAALAEFRNWWTYDVDGPDDPDVPVAQRTESAAWSSPYAYDLVQGPRMRLLVGLRDDGRVPELVRNNMLSWWTPE